MIDIIPKVLEEIRNENMKAAESASRYTINSELINGGRRMNTVDRLNILRDFFQDKGYIEALEQAIKAVELLPELVEALEFTLTQCEYTTKDMDEQIENLIKKAKGEV